MYAIFIQEAMLMSNVKIGPRHQVTIPNDVFKQLKLVVGDILNIDVKDDNIILTPAKVIPRDQAWFWTKEWQDGEAEAERNIATGRLSKPIDNAKDLIKHLRSQNEDTND